MSYVLIVDDDEDFATAVAMVLRNAGYEVAIALDTAVALSETQRRCPNLVILDAMFPEDASAGFEFARTLRRQGGKLRTVPVLMLTAVNARFALGFDSGNIDDAWLPVSDFLEKPVDFDILRERVAALL